MKVHAPRPHPLTALGPLSLALTLGLAALRCDDRPMARRQEPPPAPRDTAPRWRVRPSDGPALRVTGGSTLLGAVRGHNGAPSPPPWPATPFCAAARLDDGTWRFATEDGSLYRAATFHGPLELLGALPFRLEPVPAREGVALRGVYSSGALVVVDAALRAHLVPPEGAPRALGLERVLAVFASSRGELYAVTEPGALRYSRDGGSSFVTVRPPSGVALSAWLGDDGPLLRTTSGTFRLAGGAVAGEAPSLTPSGWLAVPESARRRLETALEGAPFSLAEGESAALPDGRVFTLRDQRLRLVTPDFGVALAEESAPADRCSLYPAFEGVRARCRHLGWAQVILTRGARQAGWMALRDEAHAEPLGDTLFDRASPAYVTRAPCLQRPQDDGATLCLADGEGSPREARLPAPSTPLAIYQGTTLAVESNPGDRAPSLSLVTGTHVAALSPPEGLRAPVSARWDRDGLALLHGLAGAPPGSPPALSFTRAVSPSPSWTRHALPPGHTRAAFGEGVTVFAWGPDAASLSWSQGGGAFAPLPSPVRGEASALALGDAPGAVCVGRWCRFAGRLTLTREDVPEATVLARASALPAALPSLAPQRGIVCHHGATARAPEIDRGVAVSGHAVTVSRTRTGSLSVSWRGETLRGSITAPFPARADERLMVRGVQGATRPAALVEVCGATGCEHLLALESGFVPLNLGRAAPSGVELHRWDDGYTVRLDDLRDGLSLVTLVRTDLQGRALARRTFALGGRLDEAGAGRWEGRDGLWIADRGGRLRFVSLDPADLEGATVLTAPAPDARTGVCAPTEAPLPGEVRWLHDVPVVRGDGWFLERGRWQTEEVLSVSRERVCLRALRAGEAHDEAEAREAGREEREPVRSFALTPSDGGALVGRAWSGERAITLRCEFLPPEG